MTKLQKLFECLEPVRTVYVEKCREEAIKEYDRLIAKLEAAGWDLEVVATYPNAHVGKSNYRLALAIRESFQEVTTWVTSTRRPGDPDLRRTTPEIKETYIQREIAASVASFDAFIHKLSTKILGEINTATLTGYAWSHSDLYVECEDGTTEKWHTEIIINRSKFNKLFNQFPTRKQK